MPSPRRRLAWLMAALALGAGAVWALVPGVGHDRKAKQSAASESSDDPADKPDISRLHKAIEMLARGHDQQGSPEDRRAALKDLLAQGDGPTQLTLILEA